MWGVLLIALVLLIVQVGGCYMMDSTNEPFYYSSDKWWRYPYYSYNYPYNYPYNYWRRPYYGGYGGRYGSYRYYY